MSTAVALGALAGLVLVVCLFVLAVIAVRRRPAVRWTQDQSYEGERWRVRTPHGPVVVTRVLDEAGFGYLIDARFRSGRIQRTMPPAILIARQCVDDLVAAADRQRA